VLLTIEPLLLEDHNWEAILEQGDPSVMRFTYDAKNLHKLSDSLHNSGLAELSASVFPAWLGYHLGAKSAVCNGSCVTSNAGPTALRNYTGDEGRPFGFGDQVADPEPPRAAAVKSCYGASGDEIASIGRLLTERWHPSAPMWTADGAIDAQAEAAAETA
jgi:hypothetical protein